MVIKYVVSWDLHGIFMGCSRVLLGLQWDFHGISWCFLWDMGFNEVLMVEWDYHGIIMRFSGNIVLFPKSISDAWVLVVVTLPQGERDRRAGRARKEGRQEGGKEHIEDML